MAIESVDSRRRRNYLINQTSPTTERTPLFERCWEDVNRVIRLELKLLEAKLSRSLSSAVTRAIVGVVVLFLGALGFVYLAIAFVFLLHKWLLWWQAFAAAGGVFLAIALFVYLFSLGSSGAGESRVMH